MPDIDLGLMDRINAYLLSKIELSVGTQISEDFFPGDADGEVMCRHDPSPVIRKRYLTGGRWQLFNFSYFCASTNVIQARQQLEAFQGVLFLDTFADSLGLSQGRLTPVTAPAPISKDEAGRTIYSSSYQLEYYQGGTQ